MEKIIFDSEFFNIKDTLTCGQTFRFSEFESGYKIFSADKCCYAYSENNKTVIECERQDEEYFENYFDLSSDYSKIYKAALNSGYPFLVASAKCGKGIRILNQNKTETLFSFMISQNNNIPRIKKTIENLCSKLQTPRSFGGAFFHPFPSPEKFAFASLEQLNETGLGYRAPYLKLLGERISAGYDVEKLNVLSSSALKNELLSIKGVGEKVSDCVMLFGYKRTERFPVDTWIEKIYKQDFSGNLSDRKAISAWLSERFGEYAGYFQQYMFHYKRNVLSKNS